MNENKVYLEGRIEKIAEYSHTLMGEKISVSGRIQSREYQKATSAGVELRTAYEVSASAISYLGEGSEVIA